MNRGDVYDQLLDWLPTWALLQIAQALRDGHELGYSDVTVKIRDGKAMDLLLVEQRRIKNPSKE